MPSRESFFNKVLGSQVGHSAPPCGILKFGKIHIFAEHEGRVQAVGEEVTADVPALGMIYQGVPAGSRPHVAG